MNPRSHILLLIFTITLVSCDKCLRVECFNGGVCLNGECRCKDGSERPICDQDACFDADVCPEGIPCQFGKCACPDSLFGVMCQFEYPKNVAGDYSGDADCDSWLGGTIAYCTVTATSNPLVFRVSDAVNGIYDIEFVTTTHFVIKEQATGGTLASEVSGEGEFKNGTFDYTLDIKSDYGGLDSKMTCDIRMN